MKDIFSLKNKVAVITGGSMGIGAMIAEGFLNFGAKVYLIARNVEQLEAKQAEFSKLGECEVISADLKDLAGIKQFVSQFAARESRLDVLVNNAGISDGGKALDDVTESDWDQVMDLNIKSIYFLIQAFLPYLRVNCSPETPKKVINIASIDGCGKINPFYNFAYGVSKAGLIQLGKHLGDSLAWEGIYINTISPGDFPTDLNQIARDYTEAMRNYIPGKRVGEKGNIAGAAIFLASDAGNYSVGSNIVVDGGESVRGIQRVFFADKMTTVDLNK